MKKTSKVELLFLLFAVSFYFTELMGLAFGSNDTDSWFKRHIIDPRPLLQSKGLM